MQTRIQTGSEAGSRAGEGVQAAFVVISPATCHPPPMCARALYCFSPNLQRKLGSPRDSFLDKLNLAEEWADFILHEL